MTHHAAHEIQHFTKHQRRQRRAQHSSLRRSSMFSDMGPFAGIRARLYSKHSDTQTSDTDHLEDLRSSDNIIRNCNGNVITHKIWLFLAAYF